MQSNSSRYETVGQGSSTAKRPWEDRPGWASCFPPRNPKTDHPPDFTGVTVIDGQKFWVNVYKKLDKNNKPLRLRKYPAIRRRRRMNSQVIVSDLPQFLLDMLASPPRAGDGVHLWIFRVARQLHAHRSEEDISNLLKASLEDCGRNVPDQEIKDAICNSKAGAWRPRKKGGPLQRHRTKNSRHRISMQSTRLSEPETGSIPS